ncbi:unnamed protein product [Urochloa humidicola]
MLSELENNVPDVRENNLLLACCSKASAHLKFAAQLKEEYSVVHAEWRKFRDRSFFEHGYIAVLIGTSLFMNTIKSLRFIT